MEYHLKQIVRSRNAVSICRKVYLKVLYHRRGCKICFSEILEVSIFSRPLFE